ncbi:MULTISPECIES: DUF6119 family protein [unclassified Empedobacter]|uniref:DUF6119 family protein n=1 Tax=unclassified Empedobacter TaxID=2643773 RepID=UPI0025C2C6F2|nr:MULTISPECIES: DUF6119 family protein [unclassified Empedobacter]
MAKSRSFSIYLLKDGYNSTNSLKEGHHLQRISENNANLPVDTVMYILNNPSTSPWWKDYWGVNIDLQQSHKGALVFLKINDTNWIALTFGSTYHQLKDEAFVHDFGIRTTLNALDPLKIKSTDILSPENAKRQRIQSPTASGLNFFDFRTDEIILKKMTGSVKTEYASLFKNITGGSSLKVSSNLPAANIANLCNSLVGIYKRDDYKTSFPEIQNIVPISDPDLLLELNDKLVEAFNQDPAPMELVLAIPEIFDYETEYYIKYSGEGASSLEFTDVFIKGYRDYLAEKEVESIESIDKFKSHRLKILDANNNSIKEYQIFKSLLFDCEYNNNMYHFCEGEWYYINRDFVQKLSDELDPLFVESHELLHQCEHKREDDYNNSVKDARTEVICLDKESITPDGQTAIEPCDLIYLNDDYLEFAHIKISTRSASLSHLFNQGINSAELLRVNEDSQAKLKTLTEGKPEMSDLINSGAFKVTYGIITKKQGLKTKGLPLFSRISLLRTVNSLKAMRIPVQIVYIFDTIDRKKKKEDDESN